MERRHDILRYCEGTEIWTLNDAFNMFPALAPHVARWFCLHLLQNLAGDVLTGYLANLQRLEALGVPVYTSQPLPFIRNQHRIDWVNVFLRLIGPNQVHAAPLGVNYFLGSPSLMLALALYEHDLGPNKIACIQSYGIDTRDTQHAQQRQAWSYWCGQAHARGIEIGGTALDYTLETEKDIGLIGLAEQIGNAIETLSQKPSASNTQQGEQP